MEIKLVKEINDTSRWGYDKTITIYVDGDEAGFIAIQEGLEGEGYIEYVEIFDKYKGEGYCNMLLISYYNMLLISCFTMFDIIDLRSDNRNENSNPICQHWTRNEDLGTKDDVRITLDEGKLMFD
jgi:hypothetical protein